MNDEFTPSRDGRPVGRAPAQRRLFFALWPDPAVVEALTRWVRLAHDACGGHKMRSDTLHLTLAFLGSVDVDRIPDLAGLLEQRRWSGGALNLDHVGRFGGPRIVWAGSSQPVPWLDVLHGALWRALAGQGYTEPEEPFRPHVSLLRQAQGSDLSALADLEPIAWNAGRLALVASAPRGSGSYYEIVAECGL